MDPQQLQDMIQQFRNMDPSRGRTPCSNSDHGSAADPKKHGATHQRGAARRNGVTSDAIGRALTKDQAVTTARAAVAADGGGAMVMGGLRGGSRWSRWRVARHGQRLSPEAQALAGRDRRHAPAGEIKA